MAHYKYERLSAQDNGFLQWETPNLPMHGGATSIAPGFGEWQAVIGSARRVPWRRTAR